MRYRYDLVRSADGVPVLSRSARRAFMGAVGEAFRNGELQGALLVYRVAVDGEEDLFRILMGTHDRAGFHRTRSEPQLTAFDGWEEPLRADPVASPARRSRSRRPPAEASSPARLF